jgi:hypothetical protein
MEYQPWHAELLLLLYRTLWLLPTPHSYSYSHSHFPFYSFDLDLDLILPLDGHHRCAFQLVSALQIDLDVHRPRYSICHSRSSPSTVEYCKHERTRCNAHSTQSSGEDGRCTYPARPPDRSRASQALVHRSPLALSRHPMCPEFPCIHPDTTPPSPQVLNRSRDNPVHATHTVDATVNGFIRMHIADRPPLPLATVSTPGVGANGLATRRLGRPALKLSDIQGVASGAKAAGLAQGRPSLFPPPRKPPSAGENGTPFTNFSKIVCAPFSILNIHSYSYPPETRQVPCASQTRLYFTQRASISVPVLPSLLTCPSSISKTNSARAFTERSAKFCTSPQTSSWP